MFWALYCQCDDNRLWGGGATMLSFFHGGKLWKESCSHWKSRFFENNSLGGKINQQICRTHHANGTWFERIISRKVPGRLFGWSVNPTMSRLGWTSKLEQLLITLIVQLENDGVPTSLQLRLLLGCSFWGNADYSTIIFCNNWFLEKKIRLKKSHFFFSYIQT